MRLIAYPSLAGSKSSRAAAPLLLFAVVLTAAEATASTRPRYGGVLRVQMHERVASLDPRLWPADSVKAAAAERLTALVFERLLRFDERGVPQAVLAVSWQHDASSKRWQFRLRGDAKFTDGAPLTPEIAALALQQLLGNAADVSTTSDSVVIQSDHAMPSLPEQLAAGPYFIFHTADDGSLSGTGAFRVAQWPSGGAPAKATFVANESCWAGRPFVDHIEVTMGVGTDEQANAVAFGQADVVELDPSEVRRAEQRGVRTASSDPVELFALAFDVSRPSVQDAHFREALGLAIDRAAIANVVLQHQSVSAGGLLPNWLSGYAFLFPDAANPARAKELRGASLVLVYDSADPEARAVAERVAVNWRDAGIGVQTTAQPGVGTAKAPAADIKLVRRHIITPDPALALRALFESLGEPAATLATPEEAFAAESAPVNAFRVIPLVHVSESYGLGPQVRDWMAPRWGGWRLEDVWLDAPAASGGTPQ
jgi:ABC-type transport system substrate-binding protein